LLLTENEHQHALKQKKKEEIQTISEQIKQKTDPTRILKLNQQLNILKRPEPLEPLEMVDALLFFPKHPRYNISSIKEVSKRIDKLEKTQNLILTN
jgi:hypothetical protein